VESLEKLRDVVVGSTGRCPCASGEVSNSGACEPSTPDVSTGRRLDTTRASGDARRQQVHARCF